MNCPYCNNECSNVLLNDWSCHNCLGKPIFVRPFHLNNETYVMFLHEFVEICYYPNKDYIKCYDGICPSKTKWQGSLGKIVTPSSLYEVISLIYDQPK